MQNLKPSPQEARTELAQRELARRKFGWFVKYITPTYDENWHHRLIIEKLEAVERGEIKKLMVFVPPQNGKSLLVSEHFPAWYFGRNPKKAIIAASYNSDLAVSFGRKARNIVASQEYKHLFNVSLSEDSQAAGRWSTNAGGEYTAIGIGGGTTGRRADIFIIDDALKDMQEAESATIQERNIDWYRSVARTRLSPTGAVVNIQTRWSDLDLAGQILAAEDDWEVISLPAIAEKDDEHRKIGEALWPRRYSLDWLTAQKKDLGVEMWSALYQQSPVSAESLVFRRNMFKERSEEEASRLMTRCFITIDPAPGKSERADFVGVCINRVDQQNYWNLKAYHVKFDPAELINSFFRLYAEYRFEALGIEKGMYYDVLKPFLDEEMRKRDIHFTIKELDHGQRHKELRIRGLLPRYEAGHIFHIAGACKDLEEELLRFPKGAHDDVADSLAFQLQVAEAPFGYRSQAEVVERRREVFEGRSDVGL